MSDRETSDRESENDSGESDNETQPQPLIENIKDSQTVDSTVGENIKNDEITTAENAEEQNDEEINEDNEVIEDEEVNEDEEREEDQEDVVDEDNDDDNKQETSEGADEDKVPHKKVKITELPLSRIKSMLKNADPDWKGGTADAHYLLVLAGERFCKQLSAQTFEQIRTTGKKTIQMRDFTSVIENDEKYDFLEGCLSGKSSCLPAK